MGFVGAVGVVEIVGVVTVVGVVGTTLKAVSSNHALKLSNRIVKVKVKVSVNGFLSLENLKSLSPS